MVKRTDLGVYDSVCDLAQGPVQGRRRRPTASSSGGVGPAFIALDNINPPSALPQEVQDKVKALAADIASGKIVVTDYLAQPQPSASRAERRRRHPAARSDHEIAEGGRRAPAPFVDSHVICGR